MRLGIAAYDPAYPVWSFDSQKKNRGIKVLGSKSSCCSGYADSASLRSVVAHCEHVLIIVIPIRNVSTMSQAELLRQIKSVLLPLLSAEPLQAVRIGASIE
jgi:hypothetical protein